MFVNGITDLQESIFLSHGSLSEQFRSNLSLQRYCVNLNISSRDDLLRNIESNSLAVLSPGPTSVRLSLPTPPEILSQNEKEDS